MRCQYYFQYGMIGAYYLIGQHFTYYDVNFFVGFLKAQDHEHFE